MKTNKNHKGLKILAVLILAIGIAIVGYGLHMMSTPKAILRDSYQYLTKGLKDLEVDNFQVEPIKSDKVRTTADIEISIAEEVGLGINKINLGIDAKEDKANKAGSYILTSSIDNQKLLDVNAYQSNNKVYLTVKDIMDKYYYIEQEFINILTEEYDYQVLIDIISNRLDTEISDEDFVKETTTIMLDGKEIKVTKLTLELTDELTDKLERAILTDIKENEEALELLANLSQVTKEEMTTTIEEELNSIETEDGKVHYTYNIYYKAKGIQKLELINEEEEYITYTANNDKYELIITDNEEGIVKTIIEKKENEQYEFTISKENMETMSGTIEKLEKGYRVNIRVMEENQETGTIVLKLEVKSSNEVYVEMSVTAEQLQVMTLGMNVKAEAIDNIQIEDLLSAKSFEEMTEDEQSQIIINLANHEVIGPILQMLMGM